jgi:hypothetical protein
MKLNQKQKDLVNEINDEMEAGAFSVLLFEKDITKLFPEFKDEFKQMCKLVKKYEKIFEKLGNQVWEEEMDKEI